jgi:Mce-associated membrane protein
MSRPTPRRPSRTTTPKPRRIAGRDDAAPEPTTPAAAAEQAPAAPAAPSAPASPAAPPPKVPPKRPVAKDPDPDDAKASAASGTGRTSTLLALLGILVLVLVLQCGWFVWNSVRDVKVAADTPSEKSSDDAEIAVPSDTPVVLNQLATQEGVQAAADAAELMFARNWESYDEGVDNAVSLMTEEFADEYRATTDDVKQEFVEKKTQVEVRVVAQSVVRANDSELEALLFLNQYVFRGKGDHGDSTYTPYRALVTMVHTDEGWLVDGVDTK